MQIDEPTAEQYALYKSMTPEERLKMGNQMYWDTRHTKEAEVQSQHPEWSEKKVNAEVGYFFLAESLKETPSKSNADILAYMERLKSVAS